MKQNTSEWLEWRRQGIGASDAAVIMGVSPWKTLFQLWEEKVLKKDHGPKGNNPAIQKGNELEPKARAKFEILNDMEMPPALVEHQEFPFLRASLDGFNNKEKAVLEIKYCSKEAYDEAKKGIVPIKYVPQLQHQLMVTGAKILYYYAFCEVKANEVEGAQITVKPDIKYIKDMAKKEQAFWDLVQSKTPPELSDKDVVMVEDKILIEAIKKYREKYKQSKTLADELSVLKKSIFKITTHPKMKFENVSLSTTSREGSIDYDKIKELDGINLDEYRKKATIVTVIRIAKEKK